jgi:glycosyltransferase involved in cell wall biosynthesis
MHISVEIEGSRTVLFFDHTAKMGGGEIALYHLVTNLDTSRYKPLVVLAGDGPLASKLREACVETLIHPLPASVVETRKDTLGLGSLLKLKQAVVCIRYAFALAKVAREHHAVLIHCNSLKADVIGGVASKFAKLPCVWHIRDHINDKYLPPRVARIFKSLARRIPSGIIVNSRSTLEQLQLPERRRALVFAGIAHDGVPVKNYDVAAKKPIQPDDPINIVLIGRITPWKGQDVFLRAAAEVAKLWPQARFQIVGTPLFGEEEFESRLKYLVTDLGLEDHVDFLGFRDDVPGLLATSTIVIHASTIGEPFGQVVIEGMAAGRPIVATDGGALREIVVSGEIDAPPTPGETGVLVKMGDANGMAAAICMLLSNRKRAAAMGESGRKRVEEHFTIANTVRRIEEIYANILGLPPPPPACGVPSVGCPSPPASSSSLDSEQNQTQCV